MKAKKNNTIFVEERKARILEIVKQHKKVTVAELCDIFNVSHATIRSDLRQLHRDNLLIRTHGGAIDSTKMGFELHSKEKQTRNLQEKRTIAQLAVGLIEDGDRIMLDTGTTTLELAKCLDKRKNINVVTNDIEIASILEEIDSVNIILIGGIIRKKFHCAIGAQGTEMLSGLIADKAIMGTNSFSLEKGAMTPDIGQAAMKKAMISRANSVILLCDSSKIGNVSFAQFATSEQIDTLVTDNIRDNDRQMFEEAGIDVIAPA